MVIHTVTVRDSAGETRQMTITQLVDLAWKQRGGETYQCGNVLFRRLGPLGITYAPDSEAWDTDAMLTQLQGEL